MSNFCEYDAEGLIVGLKKPMIHMYNKSESSVHDPELEARHNVVLLGRLPLCFFSLPIVFALPIIAIATVLRFHAFKGDNHTFPLLFAIAYKRGKER